jgi:IPT/TIG domain
MAWELHPAGSWGIATSDNPTADMPAVLALPGSWPIGQQPSCFVRKDQWGNLLATPEVITVTPNTGSVDGGTGVSLVGDGLIGTTGVTFGGTAVTGLIVNSDTLVTCLAPAHAAGTVDVVLANPRGNVTKALAFTYE